MPLLSINAYLTPGQPGAFGVYGYAAGLGAAVVPVPHGGPNDPVTYLLTVAASASGAGASIQIGGGALIPVPANQRVQVDVHMGEWSSVASPLNITFVATDDYFVDWMKTQ